MRKTDSAVIMLLNAPKDTPVEIVGINGGTHMVQKLAAMGLTHHAVVRVMRGGGTGPIVVEIRGSRVGLGQGISSRIMVRPFFSDEVVAN
ncbi:MAG: ferrous iron transport protein A [Candidatus Fermentibacteraceae bacterium]|nr:ferrous iron transport protein A [Candidatus Fermentibacteraceae bacterium]